MLDSGGRGEGITFSLALIECIIRNPSGAFVVPRSYLDGVLKKHLMCA